MTRIIFLIIVVLVIVAITMYNRIVALRNNRENAFADIDVQLQQRFDLVPNLINTVKGYASHENAIYDKIMQARSSYSSAWSIDEKISASNMLTWSLGKLFAIAESNPELKANQNFMQLQTELSDIENKVAAARRFFNSATKEFNTYIQVFPNNFIARMFWFAEVKMFEVESEEVKVAPKVAF